MGNGHYPAYSSPERRVYRLQRALPASQFFPTPPNTSQFYRASNRRSPCDGITYTAIHRIRGQYCRLRLFLRSIGKVWEDLGDFGCIAASIAILCVGGWCRKTVAVACMQMSDRSDGHCRQHSDIVRGRGHYPARCSQEQRINRHSGLCPLPILSHTLPYSPILSHTLPYSPILSHTLPYSTKGA